MATTQTAERAVPVRQDPATPPEGRAVLHWVGPGLLWMISAVGTGSVLFTPRVAAHYRYTLLWVIPAVCLLMWVMIREAGRYSIVTGRTLLDAFARLPGPGRWAVWTILVPQVLAAVVGIAGLAAITGSAFEVAFVGGYRWWAVGFVVGAAVLVVSGGYRRIEQLARWLAAGLLGITVLAALQVMPSGATVARGLVPTVPSDPDLYVIVPWIGTILAGSMGIVWFSYWTAARGYGGAPAGGDDGSTGDQTTRYGPQVEQRLRQWTRTMGWAAAAGVVGGAIVITAFLVLGSELLAPEGVVPSGTDVADDLSRLLGDVWGRTGFWLMIAAVVVALGGSVVANQDGWSRSFADMTVILLRDRPVGPAWRDAKRWKIGYVALVTTLLPVVVVLLFDDPVAIMSASGFVAAVHTPVIVTLILVVNHRDLPATLRPGAVASLLMVVSAVFYAAVGAVQIVAG